LIAPHRFITFLENVGSMTDKQRKEFDGVARRVELNL